MVKVAFSQGCAMDGVCWRGSTEEAVAVGGGGYVGGKGRGGTWRRW